MTSDATSFPDRFTEIDDLTREDHCYLRANDKCVFLGEYTAKMGFAHSKTNQLIFNFKKPMDRKGQPEWKYKRRSIQMAAQSLFKAFGNADLREYTFVPVPPSKARNDPMFDDRMMTMLNMVSEKVFQSKGYRLDIRELVVQMKSTTAAHDTNMRLKPEELAQLYAVQQNLLEGIQSNIVICDDVLTTGCHFRAMEMEIKSAVSGATIIGLFLARCTPEAIDISDFDSD